jgi:hypothetical protein
MNTGKDGLTSASSVETLKSIIGKNLQNGKQNTTPAEEELHV